MHFGQATPDININNNINNIFFFFFFFFDSRFDIRWW